MRDDIDASFCLLFCLREAIPLLYRLARKVWNIARWVWSAILIAFFISLASNLALAPISNFPRTFSKSFLGWIISPGLNLALTLSITGLLILITLPAWIITKRQELTKEIKESEQQHGLPSITQSALTLKGIDVIGTKQELPHNGLNSAAFTKTIPAAPEPYIAHPYILTRDFFGRKVELNAMDNWASSTDTMLIIEAIGGIGKSALTWEWFKSRANKAISDFAGAIWWSFYENDATVRNFIRHALAYVTGQSIADFDNIEPTEREAMLLKALHERPYLLVFDGIERILVAYHRLDASQLSDDEVEQKGGTVHLRNCTDPRDGEFLQKLVICATSKVLISTRLIPYDLQDRNTPKLIPGVRQLRLNGLEPDDAIALMAYLGIIGKADEIKKFIAQFGNHTLLIGVLAGRIINYHPAPGNFDVWYKGEGRALRLAELDMRQRRTHILQYALAGLHPRLLQLLRRVAAFRYPVDYAALSVINPYLPSVSARERPKPDELQDAQAKFHKGLTELEDRGLLQWDRSANRYDLHPLVRAYAFEGLEGEERKYTFDRIRDHFQGLPPENLDAVHELGDLHRSLEIYYALVNAGRLEDAARFYGEQLRDVLKDNIAVYDTIVELLAPLFPAGLDKLPALLLPEQQADRLTDLANAFYLLGQNEQALSLHGLKLKLALELKRPGDLYNGLSDYARSLRDDYQMAASLHVREVARDLANAMNDVDRLAFSYVNLLGIYRETGQLLAAEEAYLQFIEKPPTQRTEFWQANAERYYAQVLIYKGQDAIEVLNHAWELALRSKNKLAQLQIHHWRGEAALQNNQLDVAVESFQEAITLARASGDPILAVCLGCLARARIRQGRQNEARELIAEAFEEKEKWDVFDLHNSTATVYLALGEYKLAKEHAIIAYKKSWADGPPYSVWWDLERAKSLLKELDVPEPDMSPFDSAQVRPIPYEEEIRLFIAEIRIPRKILPKIFQRLRLESK